MCQLSHKFRGCEGQFGDRDTVVVVCDHLHCGSHDDKCDELRELDKSNALWIEVTHSDKH